MLSIRQLRYALAVWREGSFVRAAETLNVSQPAISGQVRQLEVELGFPLFRRTGHGTEVTDIGRTFLMQAEEVHGATLRLMEMAHQLRGGPHGTFAMGISSGVAPFIAPKVMQAIRGAQPHVRAEVTTTTTRRINQLLLEEKLDIGITVETDSRALQRDLACEPILRDSMVLIVAPSHPLAMRRSVDLDELSDEPLIMNELSVGYGAIVLSMFSDRGVRPKIVAISDNVETIKAMVRAECGIAVVPRFSADHDAKQALLRVLTVRPKRLMHVMLVRRVQKMSPTAESYWSIIREHLLGLAEVPS